MAYNGPAVGFSKRYPKKQPGHLLIYFSQETVTVQGGYGVVFAILVQSLIEDTRVAVQS